MSRQNIRDDFKSGRSHNEVIYCELIGGGSRDGDVIKSGFRFDYVGHIEEAEFCEHEGAEPELRLHESLYEYSGFYRLCPERKRVYLYQYVGVEIHDRGDIQRVDESGDSDALFEFEGDLPNDVSGFHGWGEDIGECEGI